MAKTKRRAKAAKKTTKGEKVISLKKTVAQLDLVTRALERLRDRAAGEDKEKLVVKVESLEKIREELVMQCHGFPVWPPGNQ